MVGLVLVLIGVFDLRRYGLLVFVATPLVSSTVTACVYNHRELVTLGRTFRLSALMFLGAIVGLFLVGFEGAVCLLMAMPLVSVLCFFGSLIGWTMARRSGASAATLWMLLLAPLPTSAVLDDHHVSTGSVREVRTAVVIAASPDRIWQHVIAFAPISEPPSILFRLGIARPLSARIDGKGRGAIRFCEFSTGAFVEPITAWEPGRRLAFDVISSPPPLRELSIYSNVSPPHLDNYLRPRRGEFRLVPLPDGSTRLEGSTWYELEMAPAAYWRAFSDALIHRIHGRVLRHIKNEVESARQ